MGMKKVIITGGSGFLGTEIIRQLLDQYECQIIVLDIHPPAIQHERVVYIKKNLLEPFDRSYPFMENPDVVIHLSGKNIFGRFTHYHTKLIYDTRIIGTRNLLHFLKNDNFKPKKLVVASAIGFYGNQPGELLTERSRREDYRFLSEVVADWESESLRGKNFKIEVSCIRNGHILGKGGLLSQVANSFKGRIGTIFGKGDEHMPWVDVRDLARLYILASVSETPEIINGVSNTLSTQRDFSYAVGKVKKTLLYLHIYKWMLIIMFGDLAHEMLVDQRVLSENFETIGFQPEYTNLDESVRYHLLS